MHDYLHRMIHLPVAAFVSIGSASASWLIALVQPWQEHVDWSLRVVASVVAIVVGIYSLRKKKKKDPNA